MRGLEPPDWADIFVPDASLGSSFLRGVVTYLSVLVMFRVVLRRQGGSIGVPDVMVVVLVSEAVSQGLNGSSKSVPNGLAGVFALLGCNYTVDWLSYRWKWLRRLLEPTPVVLVENGRVNHKHLRREQISEDELAAKLRRSGVNDFGKVKRATLESEGSVSVVPAEAPPRMDVEEATARLVEAADTLKRAIEWHKRQAME